VDARFVGSRTEAPLHWAASSDDIEAAAALLDAGADIEAPGAVLGGGPPLADAVGFGQWQVARLLVDRGATTRLKDAAALGLMDRLRGLLDADDPPGLDEITGALWSASHAGQREAAEHLLDRGADVNWIGWDGLTPLDVATQEGHQELVELLQARGSRPAGDWPT
jgi:ankyrin repeat protein